MTTRLACADFTFPLVTHDQALDLVAMLGFSGVDIGLFQRRSHLWPSREFSSLTRSARALGKKTGDRGLKVADVFLQMGPAAEPYAINHPEPRRRRKVRDWFAKTLDYANECGAEHVTFTPGVPFSGEPRAESVRRSVEQLHWCVEQARSHDIGFGVEPHIGSIVARPAQAARLVQQVPGLTFTLDYTHFTRMGVPDAEVELLLGHTSHFHIRGGRKGRLQVNFKDNVVDYGRVLRKLQAIRYRGWLAFEYVWMEWERCNESDNLSETILYRDFVLAELGKMGAGWITDDSIPRVAGKS